LIRRASVRAAAAVAPIWLGGYRFEKRSGAPQVSASERALLELFSEVGVRQSLQEARELTENTYNLSADLLSERLQLTLGSESSSSRKVSASDSPALRIGPGAKLPCQRLVYRPDMRDSEPRHRLA
jgi:hypothetical protein